MPKVFEYADIKTENGKDRSISQVKKSVIYRLEKLC